MPAEDIQNLVFESARRTLREPRDWFKSALRDLLGTAQAAHGQLHRALRIDNSRKLIAEALEDCPVSAG
jgi:hypothetical protein